MIDSQTLQNIKQLTISALVSDEILMGMLVLKGGNALNLVYNISNRGSIDIDFSMERDFSTQERNRLENQLNHLFNNEFSKEDLYVFDIKLNDRPRKVEEDNKDFWGGYLLEFKVASIDVHNKSDNNEEFVRRNAFQLHSNNSTRFTVDISKYEYVNNKQLKDIEGTIVYVYTPQMLTLEKLRALCQQVPDYKEIIGSSNPKSRARDFFDIYNLITSFNIDYTQTDNIELCRNIFNAKRVPLSYITKLYEQKDFHRGSWESVINTVHHREVLRDFDFYFDFTLEKLGHLANQSPLG